MNRIYEGNLYGAFLRIDPAKSVGPGRISRTIVAPSDHTRFTVRCRYSRRYYESPVYKGAVALEVDGKIVATSSIVDTWSLWPTFEAKFTVSQPGEHVIAFVAVPCDDGTCDILIDRVEIGYAYPVYGTRITLS